MKYFLDWVTEQNVVFLDVILRLLSVGLPGHIHSFRMILQIKFMLLLSWAIYHITKSTLLMCDSQHTSLNRIPALGRTNKTNQQNGVAIMPGQ